MHTISWDNDHAQLDDPEEIERLPDHLHERFRASAPTLVTVERADNGDSLSIGLGAEVSVLNYIRGDNEPPYYASVGERDVDAGISFRFGGESSEYPFRNAVPTSTARAAMRRFCENGELSEDVAWEET